jgi:hypothetical protein
MGKIKINYEHSKRYFSQQVKLKHKQKYGEIKEQITEKCE